MCVVGLSRRPGSAVTGALALVGLVGLVGLILVTVALSPAGVVFVLVLVGVSIAGMILALVLPAVIAGRECSGECDTRVAAQRDRSASRAS